MLFRIVEQASDADEAHTCNDDHRHSKNSKCKPVVPPNGANKFIHRRSGRGRRGRQRH